MGGVAAAASLFVSSSNSIQIVRWQCCLGDDDDDDDDGAIGAMPIPFVLSQTFEIILTLEGITPETGNTIQVNLKRINFANFLQLSKTISEIKKHQGR